MECLFFMYPSQQQGAPPPPTPPKKGGGGGVGVGVVGWGVGVGGGVVGGVVVGVELDHSLSGKCWRGGPDGVSTRELVLLFAGCNRQKRWPRPSTRQSRRDGLGGAGPGEVAG